MTTKFITEVLGVDKKDGHLKTNILQVPYEGDVEVPSNAKLLKMLDGMVKEQFKTVDAWRVTRIDVHERSVIRQGTTRLITERDSTIVRDFTQEEERKWREFTNTAIELVS